MYLKSVVNGLNPSARVVWGRVVLKRTLLGVFACARSKNCSAVLLNYPLKTNGSRTEKIANHGSRK